MKREIVKDKHFIEITQAKLDGKNRITLGKGVSIRGLFFKVYQNDLGQIILDPQITIPAHEAWLFGNQEAAAMVRAGLEDAKQRRLVKPKENYTKYAASDK